MSASRSPHGFVAVRGRGYRPDQVDRFAGRLYGELDEARERLTRLGVLAGELEEESERLRAVVATLAPPAYEALGERALLILSEVEAEAADLRARSEAAAQEVLVRAEEESRAVREAARREAARVRAGGDETAEAVLDGARGRADEVRAAARARASEVRDAAERELRETAERCEALLVAQDRNHAEESEALDRALAARETAVTTRVAELAERGGRLLAEARREHAAAEEDARQRQADAEAEAAELLARARLREEQREAVRRHMAHVRSSLAALTGRGVVGDAGGTRSGEDGGMVPGQGAPAE